MIADLVLLLGLSVITHNDVITPNVGIVVLQDIHRIISILLVFCVTHQFFQVDTGYVYLMAFYCREETFDEYGLDGVFIFPDVVFAVRDFDFAIAALFVGNEVL